MSESAAFPSFPRLPLIGAGLLVGLTLATAAITRLTGAVSAHRPAQEAQTVRDLRFEDRPNGSIAVFDASDNAEVTVLAQGANGFIRGILRSFARERRANDDAITTATAGPPFRLAMSAGRRLTIEDTATGRIIELNAFGSTNSGAFAQLLPLQQPASHLSASTEAAP